MQSCEVWLECSKELVRYRMKTLFNKFNDLTLKTGVKVKKKISRSEKMWRYILNHKNKKYKTLKKIGFLVKFNFLVPPAPSFMGNFQIFWKRFNVDSLGTFQ